MILKRISTNQIVTLSDDLLWLDEFSWKAKEQNQSRAVNGALIIQEGTKLAGRPITLGSEYDDMADIKLADLRVLFEWAALPKDDYLELEFNYQHDKRKFYVMFDHSNGEPISASPIMKFPSSSEDDFYRITLKLIQIEV